MKERINKSFSLNNKLLAPQKVNEDLARKGGDIEFVNAISSNNLNPIPEDYIQIENGYLSTLHVHGFKNMIEYFYLKDVPSCIWET